MISVLIFIGNIQQVLIQQIETSQFHFSVPQEFKSFYFELFWDF